MLLDMTILLAEESEDTTDSEEHIQVGKQTGEAKKSFTRGEEGTRGDGLEADGRSSEYWHPTNRRQKESRAKQARTI